MTKNILTLCLVMFVIGGCGMKVINPNDVNKNKGTMALDVNNGHVEVVATYTCKLESIGNRFQAIGKTEQEARDAVLGKCKDRTLLNFCKPEKIKCEEN